MSHRPQEPGGPVTRRPWNSGCRDGVRKEQAVQRPRDGMDARAGSGDVASGSPALSGQAERPGAGCWCLSPCPGAVPDLSLLYQGCSRWLWALGALAQHWSTPSIRTHHAPHPSRPREKRPPHRVPGATTTSPTLTRCTPSSFPLFQTLGMEKPLPYSSDGSERQDQAQPRHQQLEQLV